MFTVPLPADLCENLRTGSPRELTAGADLPVCTSAKLSPGKNVYIYIDCKYTDCMHSSVVYLHRPGYAAHELRLSWAVGQLLLFTM